jgi:crotonobetainyl-CoA:carnitine CoA-transferase CaiB-like acyl-CoA transferase
MLVAASMPAGPVQDDADAFNCVELRSRDWFEPIYRDDFGTVGSPGRLFWFASTSMLARRHPAKLGEDNEYVYRELLGYSAERVQGLIDAGLGGTEFSEEARGR